MSMKFLVAMGLLVGLGLASPATGAEVRVMRALKLVEAGEECRLLPVKEVDRALKTAQEDAAKETDEALRRENEAAAKGGGKGGVQSLDEITSILGAVSARAAEKYQAAFLKGQTLQEILSEGWTISYVERVGSRSEEHIVIFQREKTAAAAGGGQPLPK